MKLKNILASAEWSAPRALVIEDDQWMKPIVVRALREASPGVEIDWVETAEEGMVKISTIRYILIIADIFLKGNDSGIDLWSHCQSHCPETPVLLTSAMPIDTFLKTIKKEKVCPPFLAKPFRFGECRQIVEGLLSYSGVSS